MQPLKLVEILIGISIVSVSIYAVYWTLFRRRRTIEELLQSLEALNQRIVLILQNYPERLAPALEKSFQRYAEHTLIMEGIPTNESTINAVRTGTDYVTAKCELQTFSESNARTLHAHLMLEEDSTIAGQFRDHDVGIRVRGRGARISIPPTHQKVPRLMQEFFTWVNAQTPQNFRELLLLLIEAKLRYVIIHPHSDGNGRASRCILVGFLRQTHGMPFITIPFNKQNEYFSTISEITFVDSAENRNNFVLFVLSMIEYSFKLYIEDLLREQENVT